MRLLFFSFALFLVCIPQFSKGQSWIRGILVTKTNPTCSNSNGSIMITDSAGEFLEFPPELFRMPDTVLIGQSPIFNNLSAGSYLIKYRNGQSFRFENLFLSNFALYDVYDWFLLLNTHTKSDTCKRGKGAIKLRKYNPALLWSALGIGGALTNIPLSEVSWTWSNGQTGTDVTGLKAGEKYWLKGNVGNCPFLFPPPKNDFTFWLEEKVKILSVNRDTLFFEIQNHHTLEVGFTNIERPLCKTKTGQITGQIYGNAIPPLNWVWSNGGNQAKIDSLVSGHYEVIVYDALGCSGKNKFDLYEKNPPDYYAEIEKLKEDSCFYGNGKLKVDVFNGNPPYSLKWNNGSTSEMIENLESGYYYVSITDNLGCFTNDFFFLEGQSPIVPNLIAEDLNCNTGLGKISFFTSGGVPPYSYQMAGYPETSTPIFDSLGIGQHFFKIRDSNLCLIKIDKYMDFPWECNKYISVLPYKEESDACMYQNVKPSILNRSYWHYYKSNPSIGNYFSSGLNDSITNIKIIPNLSQVRMGAVAGFEEGCLDENWMLPGLNQITQSFTQKPVGLRPTVQIKDLDIFLEPQPILRPGFISSLKLTLLNKGNNPLESNEIEFILPSDVNFTGASIPFEIQNSNSIKFMAPGLSIGEMLDVFLFVKVDSFVPVGITKTFKINQAFYPGESVIDNNNPTFDIETMGSYDPNDIMVFPSPLITQAQNTLQYQIRFQNFGNYKADFVIIRDTLPNELEIGSFRFINSSHYISAIERKGNILIFKLMHINLPAAKDDSARSQGFVRFMINRKQNLGLGTLIENSASIYFDFNPPVKTNYAQTKIWKASLTTKSSYIVPNPAQNLFYFLQPLDEAEIEIHDFMGKKIARLNPSYEKYYSAHLLPGGLYIARFKLGGKAISEKFIVDHNK